MLRYSGEAGTPRGGLAARCEDYAPLRRAKRYTMRCVRRYSVQLPSRYNTELMDTSDLFVKVQKPAAAPVERALSWLPTWQKVLLTLSAIGFMLWIGGSVVRTTIAYDLFVPGTLVYKPELPRDAVAQTLHVYGITALYVWVGYGMALSGFLPVFISLRRRWRSYGWLFMAGVLFLMFIPLEAVFAYFDWRISQTVGIGLGFDIEEAKSLLLEAFSLKFLGDFGSGARWLTVFGYLAAIAFIVWRPLHRQIPETPER